MKESFLNNYDGIAEDGDVVEVEYMKTPIGNDIVYVNVNGFCRLRVTIDGGELIIVDRRLKPKKIDVENDEILMVSKRDAIQAIVDLGYQTAPKWTKTKLEKFLNSIHKNVYNKDCPTTITKDLWKAKKSGSVIQIQWD